MWFEHLTFCFIGDQNRILILYDASQNKQINLVTNVSYLDNLNNSLGAAHNFKNNECVVDYYIQCFS